MLRPQGRVLCAQITGFPRRARLRALGWLVGVCVITCSTVVGAGPSDEPLGVYLESLERAGRTPAESATPQRLRDILVRAETLLASGDARSATALLFAVVEAKRFAPLAQTDAYQNAEFLLGRALSRGRAYLGAQRYLGRVLARGPQAAYFVPAFRALVDVALETGRFGEMVAQLQSSTAMAGLPPDSRSELAYLRGRAAWGDAERADHAFAQVTVASRLYPAAQYFRALAAVQRQDFKAAKAALCLVADQKDQDSVSFNIDQRFFRLKDMARLALARIAHEQGHYDEAYYYYFAIPEESERLNAALFEASWSMSQQGQFAAARAFADQFDRLFPSSPLRPEMALLRANLAVKTCNFDGARAEATALVTRYQPLSDLAASLRRSASDRERLLVRLIKGHNESARDLEGQLLEILKLDDEFKDLVGMLADLDVDSAEALAGVKNWRTLGALSKKHTKALPPTASVEAVGVLQDAQALLDQGGHSPQMVKRLGDLILDASLAAFPVSQAGPYEAEARQSQDLARSLANLRQDIADALRAQLEAAIANTDDRLRSILGATRLVHIDAVVGKKKKLELQISALTEGRIPAEVFHKLQAEGTIADDEIYWPFEGEQWADEYENFR